VQSSVVLFWDFTPGVLCPDNNDATLNLRIQTTCFSGKLLPTYETTRCRFQEVYNAKNSSSYNLKVTRYVFVHFAFHCVVLVASGGADG
jgi:hypothetical protein